MTKKQEQLDVSEQLQESQIQSVAATVAELFQELKKDMMKQIRKDMSMKGEEEEEEEAEDEDEGQDKGEKWRRANSRRRRTKDPDAIINDSTDRPAAAKSAGEDLGAEEVRQEEEREKTKVARTDSPAKSDESKTK